MQRAKACLALCFIALTGCGDDDVPSLASDSGASDADSGPADVGFSDTGVVDVGPSDTGALDAIDAGVDSGADTGADAGQDAGGRDAFLTDIQTSGEPAQMFVACASGMACGAPNPTLVECFGLNFGLVESGAPPCDRELVVQNVQRSGLPTRDLVIERIDLLVEDIDTGMVWPGDQAGFSVLAPDGTPVIIDALTPLVVNIPSGLDRGEARLLLRFDGTRAGLFRGEASRGTGLQLHNNDPDQQPFGTVPITAFGAAPMIAVFPSSIAFGAVMAGATATATLQVLNVGSADLQILDIVFMVDGVGFELTFTTDRGPPPFSIAPTEAATLTITYQPTTDQPDPDQLLITSNDPVNGVLAVPVGP